MSLFRWILVVSCIFDCCLVWSQFEFKPCENTASSACNSSGGTGSPVPPFKLALRDFVTSVRRAGLVLTPKDLNNGRVQTYIDAFTRNGIRNPWTNIPACNSTNSGQLCCEFAPRRSALACTTDESRYSAIDGSCNNVRLPWVSLFFTPYIRITRPEYADGISAPRRAKNGNVLPSARLVTTVAFDTGENPSPCFSYIMMQWGQFVAHDITMNVKEDEIVCDCCPNTPDPRCYVVPIPPADKNLTGSCMNFMRSKATPNIDCDLGPREHLNAQTPILDGSVVYGASTDVANGLRSFSGGTMNTFFNPTNKESLLPQSDDFSQGDATEKCFSAGDSRVNVSPHLMTMQTLFVREHNRIAATLGTLRPDWDDETLYQESRRIIAAMLQHITYREYLPIVLGSCVTSRYGIRLSSSGYYNGYDNGVNPQIFLEFATAAFRFGHSSIASSFKQSQSNGSRTTFRTREGFFQPHLLYNDPGATGLMLGMMEQPMENIDAHFSGEIVNHLFEVMASPDDRLDLPSSNIQRGRDHGLPGYLTLRRSCGLPAADSFDSLQSMSVEARGKLKKLYCDVDDIDLYVGGILETRLAGSLVGPTFACIIANQFRNLRLGDRFWYEKKERFTTAALAELRKASLARILCNNLVGIQTIQPWVFELTKTGSNAPVPCSRIPQMDLSKFLK